jgi:hypothetical protein
MNTKLIEALLSHFDMNHWKRSRGLIKIPPFDRWAEDDVKDHIAALSKVGILEKRADTLTASALYRINRDHVLWWADKLKNIAAPEADTPSLDFRTLYILYVIGTFYLEHQRPPRQSELYYTERPGHHGGLINDWVNESGAIAEDPGISGAPHLRKASLRLAGLGYMAERGEQGNRQPYLLTEKGLELVRQLQALHWREWPVARK